jgi:superfamily I DNA/RNA helicase
MDLDDDQRRVVDHDGGPLVVEGGFGSGKSAALRARAERLRRAGRRPWLVHHRELVGVAVAILRRHGRDVDLAPSSERRRLVGELVDHEVDEVAAAILGFQASFLGDEELRVHADAAGCLDVAEELIAVTARYLQVLAERRQVDESGALVQASLLLRDLDVLDTERARFDELLVDDFQLASFATNRLVTQLAGAGGPLVVAGNADAAVSAAPLASPVHLDRFPRRFGATTIELAGRHRVPGGPPELRLLDPDDDGSTVAVGLVRPFRGKSAVIVHRDGVEEFVGHEAALVVVQDATDGRWPAPAPNHRWFDPEVFHGPDVIDDAERALRWHELERRRFLVATTRATERTVVLAHAPVTPFVSELLR